MSVSDDVRRRAEATEVFKLGLKASKAGVHRTLNRPPKGKGWVQCVNSPEGLMCRPEKVRESIELFRRAYRIWPDIVALKLIALAHEMLGERETAREAFERMREQALAERLAPYVQAAELGLSRVGPSGA
jgi:hypothetical protein